MTVLRNIGLAAAIIVVIGLIVLGALKGGIPTFGCSGLSDCYQASQGIGANERERRGNITQFTASANLFAFPVSLDGTTEILLVDRGTNELRLLSEPGAALFGPRLSADGRRLTLLRREKSAPQADSKVRWSETRQILSCAVVTWRCTTVTRVNGVVMSPVEINERTILYALHLPRAGFDLYAASPGRPPVRVTQDLHAGSIDAISLADGMITFNGIFLSKDPLQATRSEIYQLAFDAQQLQADVPPKLKPIVLLDGFSLKPAAAVDGVHLAFLHTVTGKGKYHYKLALGDLAKGTHRIVEVTGKTISLPAFVGDEVNFAELFDDRYEFYEVDPASSEKRKVADVKFSAIKQAERVIPTISSCGRRCMDRASLRDDEAVR